MRPFMAMHTDYMKTVMMTDEMFSNVTDARAEKKTALNAQPEPISQK